MFNIVELFSGIGSQAKAFERLSQRRNFEFQVLNTCEWDVHAIVAYDYIHNNGSIDRRAKQLSREQLLIKLKSLSLSNDGKVPMKDRTLDAYSTEVLQRIYSSILKTNNLISVEDVKGADLPNNIDLMTYSFPCQDLSNVGALHGYNKGIDRNAHTRSGLLWEVERMLNEREEQGLDLPRFLLLENVTALEAKRHAQNFDEWKNRLEELGYVNKVNRLYAPDFGIPQNRKRLLMLSVYVGKDERKRKIVEDYFNTHDLNDRKYIETLGIPKGDLKDYLKLDYKNKELLQEALLSQPRKTDSRDAIWKKNSQLYLPDGTTKKIAQTITTKQDRHPNSGNIYFNPNNNGSRFRFLTPRECFTLMGFDENDYISLKKNNFYSRKNALFFSRDKMYKLAGNSIVVNMLEAIFNQAYDLHLLMGEHE
ncbi:MAG: DNA (cytosine-5-)-methyltransferase [Bacilli bacterium]